MYGELQFESQYQGSSYPESSKKILASFSKLLKGVPESAKARNMDAANNMLILPHIDFRVNLSIYASTYHMLVNKKNFPELFIILGVGHRCPAEFSACPISFSTPLGQVECDLETWLGWQKKAGFPLGHFPETFRGEHSLEYVVIWLQTIRDLYFPDRQFKILPILMGGLHSFIEDGELPGRDSAFTQFGHALKAVVGQRSADEVCWIASIDGCHVGPRFGHCFGGNEATQCAVRHWEKRLWDTCRSESLDVFFEHLSSIRNMFYFDGVGVLTLLLQHFQIEAKTHACDLWYEQADQSFVTFTGGMFQAA